MNKCSILKVLCLAAVAVLFAGCEKADGDGRIEIFAEPLDAAKVRVGDVDSIWVDGDRILINGDEVEVERHAGHAYINYSTPLSDNRAVYPASIASGALSDDAATVTLPAVYHYRADANGYQLLELPMAARSKDNEDLKFMHLTGALCFIITNNEVSSAVTLQSLTVSSNDGYQLSGDCSFNFNSIESIDAEKTAVTANQQVTLLFDTGYVLTAGASVRVTVPVLPVGADNHFNVQVKLYREGDDHGYLYNRSQPSGGSLIRNQLGFSNVGVTATVEGYISSTSLLTITNGTCHIQSARDFELWYTAVENNWTFPGGTYRTAPCSLDNDIDLTGVTITPIITYGGSSAGLNGNNHTISNLTIESCKISPSDNNYICGLFKVASDNPVYNITFDNLALKHIVNTSSNLSMGALYATATTGAATMSNCRVSIGSIDISGKVEGTLYFGGLVGEASKALTFTNCHVTIPTCTIERECLYYWGGFVGTISASGVAATATSSSWRGSVNLTSGRNVYVGGYFGYKNGGTVTINNDTIDGNINITLAAGKYYWVGSLIGRFVSPGSPSFSAVRSLEIKLNGNAIDALPDYSYSNY